MDFEKECPIVKVDGFIEKGKQFDVEIVLPEDNRNVIYGVIKDFYRDPIEDAVVKLIEICHGERRPVSHTFTNKAGEFVFGPLCPDKEYEILFWVDKVKHVKICKECTHQGGCLKGTKLECPQPNPCKKECDPCKDECKEKEDECGKKDSHKNGYNR